MSRILLSLMLIGTLLFGQTFCCCTAKASALLESVSAHAAPGCCCGEGHESCPDRDQRQNCPCKHKRQLADVGTTVNMDASVQLQHGLVALVTEDHCEVAVEIIPLMASRDAQRESVRALPRADRVALSQLLLC